MVLQPVVQLGELLAQPQVLAVQQVEQRELLVQQEVQPVLELLAQLLPHQIRRK
jgi:hypothetical protein